MGVVERDLTQPIAVHRPVVYRGECGFSYDDGGTKWCGADAPYRFTLAEGREHSTCPEHALVVRHWPNLTRMWLEVQ